MSFIIRVDCWVLNVWNRVVYLLATANPFDFSRLSESRISTKLLLFWSGHAPVCAIVNNGTRCSMRIIWIPRFVLSMIDYTRRYNCTVPSAAVTIYNFDIAVALCVMFVKYVEYHVATLTLLYPKVSYAGGEARRSEKKWLTTTIRSLAACFCHQGRCGVPSLRPRGASYFAPEGRPISRAARGFYARVCV